MFNVRSDVVSDILLGSKTSVDVYNIQSTIIRATAPNIGSLPEVWFVAIHSASKRSFRVVIVRLLRPEEVMSVINKWFIELLKLLLLVCKCFVKLAVLSLLNRGSRKIGRKCHF